jgi:hypothetical protein
VEKESSDLCGSEPTLLRLLQHNEGFLVLSLQPTKQGRFSERAVGRMLDRQAHPAHELMAHNFQHQSAGLEHARVNSSAASGSSKSALCLVTGKAFLLDRARTALISPVLKDTDPLAPGLGVLLYGHSSLLLGQPNE